MLMIDIDYNDDYFNLSQVFWSDKIIAEDKTKAEIRIPARFIYREENDGNLS